MAKHIIVVDFHEDHLYAVEIALQPNIAEVIRYIINPIPDSGINPSWLRTVWSENHLSHSQIICVLPDTMIRYRTLSLPNLPTDQLLTAARFELENNSNLPPNQIFQVLYSQLQEQLCQVKVAIIDNQRLNEQIVLFRQAGIELLWSGIRTHGIQNYINFTKGFFTESNESIAYLVMNVHRSEFGIIHENEMLYCHDFNLVSNDLANVDGSEPFEDFLQELRLSIVSSRNLTNSADLSKKLWFFGKKETADLLQNTIEQLGFSFYLPDKSGLLGVLTAQNTTVLAPLIGLALDETPLYSSENNHHIYSLEQCKRQISRQQSLKWIEVGLLLSFTFGGLFLGLTAQKVKQAKLEQWIQEKSTQISSIQMLEQSTSKNLQQIKSLEDWLKGTGRELEFLKLFKENIPSLTKITDLTLEDGVIKDITGITPSVSELLTQIQKEPGLQNLKLKGTIAVTQDGEIFHLEGFIPQK